MRHKLIQDYLFRAEKRIKMLEFLKNEQDYADVVREAQEVVELLLKALIMSVGLEIPKVHDVSGYIGNHLEFFPEVIKKNFEKIRYISRELRKERELAFYGAHDWIPGEEYTLEEAERAINWAKELLELVKEAIHILSPFPKAK
ncbi:MAG: HEPN domain-containing protein [Candidatus Desulfofervidus auxilii]|nr:HEPN domain-containing protein [Candidatus Desulfofervidus auxilii]